MSDERAEYSNFVQKYVVDKRPYREQKKANNEVHATMNVTTSDWSRMDVYKRETGLSKRVIITMALDAFFDKIKKEGNKKP